MTARLVAQLVAPEMAAALQLMGEYDPQPPTPFGNPDNAPEELVAGVRAQFEQMSVPLTDFLAAKSA